MFRKKVVKMGIDPWGTPCALDVLLFIFSVNSNIRIKVGKQNKTM